ncbi:MAG: TetR/AcrR family transcriptional regulator [Actinomycetales bacterium]
MTVTPETARSGKAGKVLTAAEELILKQGFKGVTMAAVAQRAKVGKGTTYLYWRTKEDLFLELIVSNLAETLAGLAERVRVAPELAVADELCPAIAEAWLRRPLVRAVQTMDGDVLGALLDDPRARAIAVENGAPALIKALLPVWRERNLVRVDWSLQEQADALELVLVGYFVTRTHGVGAGPDEASSGTLRRTVASVLQSGTPADAGPDVAEQVSAVLDGHAQRLLELVR